MTLCKFLNLYQGTDKLTFQVISEDNMMQYGYMHKEDVANGYANLLKLHIVAISFNSDGVRIELDGFKDHKYPDYAVVIFRDFLDVATRYSTTKVIICSENKGLMTSAPTEKFLCPQYQYHQIGIIDTDTIRDQFIIVLKDKEGRD